MPGNSTCHVEEKEQLQRGEMADSFFEGGQDCMCPVTTISSLMDKCDITQVDLLKVDRHISNCSPHMSLANACQLMLL